MEHRRIALSMKALLEPSDQDMAAMEAEASRQPRRRKKPLRGGYGTDGGGLFDGLLGN
jgi:hypothetical protein